MSKSLSSGDRIDVHNHSEAVMRTTPRGPASRPETRSSAALAGLETELRARGDVVRVELATVAIPASAILLTERGYRLLGFEDVWLCPLTAPELVRASGVDVQRVGAMESWRTTTIEAVACPDGT